jgi:murein L,D-transpeptidase YafK
LRTLLASAAIASALALAGCDTDGVLPNGRALAPLSDKMLADIEQKGMSKESPILVRLFKEEAELEVWKQDNSGRFALLKTYPICRWSGELGPKMTKGDRQAPEGFYMITPGLMNPNSNYYLAINTGFPNAYDRANGRTGDFLMIHGDCSSAGCYAMTDEQIAEIYALARESFFGGQRAFQIQAYPFHMTPLNMAKHRNSPHMAFWRMLKEGYDHFEVSRLEPKVDVCEKHYVFDAESTGKFSPAAKCPVYKVPEDIVAAVQEKQQTDEREMASLVARGTPTVPVTTGTDGGMNEVFLAAVRARGGTETSIHAGLPGTIPANIRPPRQPGETTTGSTMSLASADSRPVAGPQQASAGGGNLFGNLFASNGAAAPRQSESSSPTVLQRMSSFMGLGGSEPPPAPAAAEAPKPKTVKPAPTATAAATRAKSEPQHAEAKATPAPASKPAQEANAAPAENSANAGLLSGAQPTVPAGFDSRFGAFH